MRKLYKISQPTKQADLKFDNVYIEIRDKWEQKAKSLQARRWQHIKQLTKYGKLVQN